MMVIAQAPSSGSLVALGAILVTIIVVVLIWQIFKTGRTGVTDMGDKTYRQLAEETAKFQNEMRSQMSAANEALTDIQKRVAEIERLLKEVE